MTEQNWLGNSDFHRTVVMDPLTDPRFTWTTFYLDQPHNHGDEARCGPDCPSTPIYADVYANIGLPNPWTDWPMASIYVGLFPDHSQYYVRRFIFGQNYGELWQLPDDPFDPAQWIIEGQGTWTLPDYSYDDGPDDPPWVTRQENPEK